MLGMSKLPTARTVSLGRQAHALQQWAKRVRWWRASQPFLHALGRVELVGFTTTGIFLITKRREV